MQKPPSSVNSAHIILCNEAQPSKKTPNQRKHIYFYERWEGPSEILYNLQDFQETQDNIL